MRRYIRDLFNGVSWKLLLLVDNQDAQLQGMKELDYGSMIKYSVSTKRISLNPRKQR